MNTSPDAGLGRALREGGEDALGALYDRHLPGLFDFLSRSVRDSAAAEDLAQMTFVRAWEARESLQDPGRVRGWLYTIAHNLAINHLSRSRRTEPIDEQFDLAAVAPGPEDQAAAKEMAELVWAAAASLEPRQYAVLDLHVRRDLPTGEIAQALDVPVAHAAVLVNRAKEALGNAVRYLLVARRRDHCLRLGELVPEGVASLTPEQRSSVDRHMRRCPECQGLARTLTEPGELFGALLPLPVPSSLKRDGRDFVLVAARRQRQDEARQLGPRRWQLDERPESDSRRRLSRRAGVLALAGLGILLLLIAGDALYLHRPPPSISVHRAALDQSSPSPSATPSITPPVITDTTPADATPAGGSEASQDPAATPARTPSASGSAPSNHNGNPTPSTPPRPAPPASSAPPPTSAPTSTPAGTPTPTGPPPTATPTAPPSTPHATPAITPTPTATPTVPPGPPHATPASTPPPPPPPANFAVTRISMAGPAACFKAAGGYRCDFSVVVAYRDASAGSSVAGALTATSASTHQREVRSRDFATAVTVGTGSVTVPVSVLFTSLPCAPYSSATAATGQPSAAGSGPVAFGQGCPAS